MTPEELRVAAKRAATYPKGFSARWGCSIDIPMGGYSASAWFKIHPESLAYG